MIWKVLTMSEDIPGASEHLTKLYYFATGAFKQL